VRSRVRALVKAGAEVVVADGENEVERVRMALTALADRGVTTLLLEGGPRLAEAFFEAGEIDELRFFVAPRVLGDGQARSVFEGGTSSDIENALSTHSTCTRVGEDLLISARLHSW
jgi:diaminohydroxyphosphoribosylaminopyrimidine deaminase/5-amino-6-(5-phosphoribosylamino)uracil reductase